MLVCFDSEGKLMVKQKVEGWERERKEVIKFSGKKHMFSWQHFDLYGFVYTGS